MNRNEIVLGYLLQAEQYLDAYLAQLNLAQQTTFPQNVPYLITASQFQLQYLYYLQLVNDPCGNADNPEQCYEDELLTYGVIISSALPLTAEQLPFALSAVQMVASRLVELLAEYNQVAVSTYDPKVIFQDVFGALIFEYNPAIDYSTGSGTDRITLGTNLLNQADEDDPRRTSIIEGVIIHELGHVFENLLGLTTSSNATFSVDPKGDFSSTRPPEDSNRTQIIQVVGGTNGTPLVVEDYLNFNGDYWSGNKVYDFGDWFRAGGFLQQDTAIFPTLTPLTASLYNSTLGTEIQCQDGTTNCYVNRTGNEISSPIYVIRAGTYQLANTTYSPQTALDFLYFNERRQPDVNTPGSNPMEGIADTFSAFMRLGTEFVPDSEDGPFPPDEPRRVIFEQNFCVWLSQLVTSVQVQNCLQQ